MVLGTDDPTERKVLFVAMLTSDLPKSGSKPVLVGGSAIEVYLDGMLRTGDMDLVYNIGALEAKLKEWGFERTFRSWANAELGLAVDPVGKELAGSYDRVTTITTEYGPATVIGVEDLILKRLASAKHWKYPTDMEQAYLLAKAQGDRVDWRYLEDQADKQRLADYLTKLRAMIREERGGHKSTSAGRRVG